jgi:hypothetical protein
MATASVTNTLVSGAPVLASGLNANFADVVDFLNTNVLQVDGSKSATNPITVATPTSDLHAATKAYVDSGAAKVVRNYSNARVDQFLTTRTCTFAGGSTTATDTYTFPVTVSNIWNVQATVIGATHYHVKVTSTTTTNVVIQIKTIDGSSPAAATAVQVYLTISYLPV